MMVEFLRRLFGKKAVYSDSFFMTKYEHHPEDGFGTMIAMVKLEGDTIGDRSELRDILCEWYPDLVFETDNKGQVNKDGEDITVILGHGPEVHYIKVDVSTSGPPVNAVEMTNRITHELGLSLGGFGNNPHIKRS